MKKKKEKKKAPTIDVEAEKGSIHKWVNTVIAIIALLVALIRLIFK